MSAEPTSIGDGVDSTMFAELYGELMFHPWWDPNDSREDIYSMFHARSLAMGWLEPIRQLISVERTNRTTRVSGLWSMNDAGWEPVERSKNSHTMWFQVSVRSPIPYGKSLPVQQFLRCAGDVVERMGVFKLRMVRILLPLQALSSGDDRGALLDHPDWILLDSTGWFEDCDPSWRTPVHVILESGEDSSILSAAPEMLRWIRQLDQKVFSCDSFSPTDSGDEFLPKPSRIETWLDNPNHRVTFHGTLAEWSMDALGWTAALLADAGSQNGIRAPFLGLTANKT